MRKLYLLAFLLTLTSSVFAQGTAASYTFSAFSSSFSTIVGASGTTSTSAISGDDYTMTSISIGFNFRFACTTYNTLSACTNGWLSLANSSDIGYHNTNTTVSYTYYPTPGSGFLMGYWDDLHGGGHTAYYRTSGSSPNRVFTFEWNNFHTFSASGNATFQIKLYETSNIIEYCYGSSSYSGMTATIGIANSTSDYLTLNGTGSSPGASSSTFYSALSASPAANQVYRFTPILSVAPSGTACSGNTLTLNGTITAGAATSYAWAGPGGYTSTLQNPTRPSATTAMSGIYTFTATYACGSTRDTTTVRVDSTPTATISGTTAICSGGSSNITFTGTAGATVSYTINGGSPLTVVIGAGGTATVSTGTLTTGGTATTYTYALTGATLAGCSQTLSGSAVVTVNPLPTAISGPSVVCENATITLSSTAGGTWTSSNTSIATVGAGTGVVYGVSAGVDTITYTLATGCSISTAITVNPAPAAITGPSGVCIGSSVTLASATTGGAWTTSSGVVATVNSTGVVTGVSVSTATITYTLTSTGCYTTLGMTVNPLPASISGPSSVCEGSNITLSNSSTGGTWTSSNISIATVGSSSGIVYGVAAGTDTVTYTLPTGCSISTVVIVNQQPSSISGTTAVCAGSTTSLAATPTGGAWTSSNSTIATVNSSGLVTGVSAATATISYTLAAGCFSVATVTVNPLPAAITGARSVCLGASTPLATTSTGGTWTSSNSSIATISTSGTVFGANTGLVNISYTLPTGCYTTDTFRVYPLPGAISGPSAVCAAFTVNLTCTPTGGSWSTSNAGVASVISTGDVTGISAGSATITYTTGTGCYSTTSFTVNPAPAAIAGPIDVCEGSTITLSSATTGGTWTSGNTAVATIDPSTGVVTGIAAGGVLITYTGTTTCFAIDSITVNPLPSPLIGPDSVCIGSTTYYTTSGGSGTWSSTGTYLSYDPFSGGIDAIGVGHDTLIFNLMATGCFTSKPITINDVPSAITGPSSVCEAGGIINLTNATGGGVWSTSDNTIATVDTAGQVTGLIAGSVTIFYTSSVTTCATFSTITVEPLPPAIGGPSAVCAGSTITLTNTMTGGTWSSSNTTIATISASGIVTGVAAGVDTITYTSAAGCLITKSITVNGPPGAITGPTAVCQGLVITLSNSVAGGTWSSSNTSLASIDASGNVTGVAPGVVTITYVLGSGCNATALVTVNSIPGAISGSSDVCHTYTVAYTDPTAGGTWGSSDGSIATVSTGGIVTGVSIGSAVITYTMPTGCIQTASITVDPLPAVITGAPAVCVGSSTTFTDSVTGGSWTTSNASIASVNAGTGVVTGVAAGSCNITYTIGSGCFITTSITVNPLPASITGPTNVCEFSSVTLSNASGTGSWSSSNTTIASINAATGSAYGVATGSATIYYTLPTTCRVSYTLTVNPTPVAITGTTNVCEAGGVTMLSDATTGGSWTTSNASVASVAAGTGVVTGVASGTVTITYSVGTCYATTAVNVIALPGSAITALSDTVICPGTFVVLTSTTGTGYTYQWYSGASAISGETSSFYTAYSAGAYRVSVTNTYGCTSISAPMSIIVSAVTATASAAGATTFCAGGSVTLNANTGAGLSYQWQVGGMAIAGATASGYSATASGNYNVVVTNAAGCSATSSSITVSVTAAPAGTLTVYGPLAFCNGDSVVMAGDTAAGITYQWQLGGVNITGATNVSYTAFAPGGYQLFETNTAGCISSSALATVTVYALPNSTISASGATTFCVGGSVTLSVPFVAGSTYQWLNAGVPITGATNNTYTVSYTSSIRVKVTSATGCVSISAAPIAVNEVAVPVVIPLTPTVFCWGGGALLGMSISASAGVTFQWYSSGVAMSGATNSTYNALTSGTFSCVVSVGSGACIIGSVAVSVVEMPSPNPVITWDGLRLKTGNFYTSYQWFKNSVPISGATGWYILPTDTARYSVQVNDTNGCRSISPEFVLYGFTTNGIGQLAQDAIRIFPNPAENVLHINAPFKLRAVLNSMDGRRIIDQPDATDIDVSMLPGGTYLLLLYDENGIMIKAEKVTKN